MLFSKFVAFNLYTNKSDLVDLVAKFFIFATKSLKSLLNNPYEILVYLLATMPNDLTILMNSIL